MEYALINIYLIKTYTGYEVYICKWNTKTKENAVVKLSHK